MRSVSPPIARSFLTACIVASAAFVPAARAEVILQYFETPWAEIEARMPEIAAAGYDALWLPPPTKGSEGIRDVGFAVYDRFDLGDQNQRGTTATRYGTTAQLKSMVQVAHRFGVRVYFDVVMNHNGNPGTVENVGVEESTIGGMVELDGFPDTVVWDYHVLPARFLDGGELCAGRTGCEACAFQPAAAGDTNADGPTPSVDWRVLTPSLTFIGGGGEVCVNRDGDRRIAAMTLAEACSGEFEDFCDLSPFTQSVGSNGGVVTHLIRAPRMSEFDDFQFQVTNWSLLGLIDFATEQYLDGTTVTALDGTNAILGTPLPSYVRNADRPATYQFEGNGQPYPEDIREYMMRWIRWLMLETGADGFRLDAIKHVWPNFYAADFPGDPIAFNQVIQDAYDEMHGHTDSDDADPSTTPPSSAKTSPAAAISCARTSRPACARWTSRSSSTWAAAAACTSATSAS
jgi:hypothetical protein